MTVSRSLRFPDAEEVRKDSFTITELSETFGVTPRAIRFYEDKGLLAPMRVGLARIYGRRDRARLKLILRARRLGFSLDDVREMLDLYDVDPTQVEQLKAVLRKGRERLAALEAQRRDIDEAIEELRDGCREVTRLLRDKGAGVEPV